MQARVLGGLKPATGKALRAIANGKGGEKIKTRGAAVRLKPGARLVREWRGRVHTVEVLDDGFAYRGESYRSLSAVAMAITGAKWSGPRFFAL